MPILDLKPEDLHKWYLEATKKLNTESYNKNAQKPYEELSEEQKSIDKFICKKIKQRIRKACEFYKRYEYNPELLIKEYPKYKETVAKFVLPSDFGFLRLEIKGEDKVLKQEKVKLCDSIGYKEWLFKEVENARKE